MKHITYVFALAASLGFASCNSPSGETKNERVERDQAAKSADKMEGMQEQQDTTAVIEK